VSLTVRALKIVLTLGTDTFQNGANQKTIYSASLEGYLHIDASIELNAGIDGSVAIIAIYGQTVDDCMTLTRFNPDYQNGKPFSNQIEVYAGYINPTPNQDGGYDQTQVINLIEKLPLLYLGVIISASANFNDVNRPFIIQSNISGQSIYKLLPSTSIVAESPFSIVAQQIIKVANNNGFNFEYGGIFSPADPQVNNGVYNGSPFKQLLALCHDYGFEMIVGHGTQSSKLGYKLSFIQLGIGVKNMNPTILAPAENNIGMIGYPITQPIGLLVKEFFNPNRKINDRIELKSYYTALNGIYTVFQSASFLQTHGESWESTLTIYDYQSEFTL